MLTPRELYRAQGFPADYIIERGADGRALTKTAQVRLCGNSVCPPIARALVAVEQRATAAGPWRTPTLYAAEIDAISTLVDVHLYQLQQLSYGEFRAVYQKTIGQVRTQGGQVVMGMPA